METIESGFALVAGIAALAIEIVAVTVIIVGAARAVFRLLRARPDPRHPLGGRKVVWLHFGVWLLLGLEFTLAADIIRTAITPSWDDIGRLAAIAVIRTFLNYFLERDLERSAGEEPAGPQRAPPETRGVTAL